MVWSNMAQVYRLELVVHHIIVSAIFVVYLYVIVRAVVLVVYRIVHLAHRSSLKGYIRLAIRCIALPKVKGKESHYTVSSENYLERSIKKYEA